MFWVIVGVGFLLLRRCHRRKSGGDDLEKGVESTALQYVNPLMEDLDVARTSKTSEPAD